MNPRPVLRPEVDAAPTEQDGQTFFVLHDRSGISPAQLAVSPVVMYIASLLDGSSTILDIQDRFAKETGGQRLSSEDVLAVLNQLDECLFLKGDKFSDMLEQKVREFTKMKTRPARSAGVAYSDNPAELADYFDEAIKNSPASEEAADSSSSPPLGVIAPHIDFQRGIASYAQVYRELSMRDAPETVVVIGTAHYPLENAYSILDKDFEVPGGVVKNASQISARLVEECKGVADFSRDRIVHSEEHSIELQAVWIRHLWGDKTSIVPVLAGPLDPCLHPDDQPSGHHGQRQAFCESLKKIMAESDGIMLMASADLSHVGPRFGDRREISDGFLRDVELADRDYLAAVANGDAENALAYLGENGDQYHVCGIGCIYALNVVLPGTHGRLLGYHQAVSPEARQAVTFAGMIFDR